MVIFTKKVELVSVTEKQVPFFTLQSMYNSNEKNVFKESIKQAEIEEYRISYWLFGMLIWVYTKIVEVKYVRLFK